LFTDYVHTLIQNELLFLTFKQKFVLKKFNMLL